MDSELSTESIAPGPIAMRALTPQTNSNLLDPFRLKNSHFETWIDVLTERTHTHPSQIAQTFLTDGECRAESQTYLELLNSSQAIAARIQQMATAGDRVLLLYPAGLGFTAGFMGCLFSNTIAVPSFPPRRGKIDDRLSAIIQDAVPRLVLTTSKLKADLEQNAAEQIKATHLTIVATDEIPLAAAEEWIRPNIKPDTLAFLQYTSGSTGDPKGVMVSHLNLLSNARLIEQSFLSPSYSRAVFWLPEYHDMGLIGGVLQPLLGGIESIHLSPVDFIQKPIRWLQAVSRYGAITTGGPNFGYDLCVERITDEQCEELDLSSLKMAFSGAEPVRNESLVAFSKKFEKYGFDPTAFSPCYGMAESTLFITGVTQGRHYKTLTVDSDELKSNHLDVITRDNSRVSQGTESKETKAPKSHVTLVGCGQVSNDLQVVIVDPVTSQLCRPLTVGEIWITGASCALGYWGKPEVTQQTFNATLNSFEGGEATGNSFLKTGDLGVIVDGELYVTGRVKDVIIIRGRNYYPQDIERCAEKSHAALRNGCSAAFSVDTDKGEQLVLACELKRQSVKSADCNEIAKCITRSLAGEFGIQPGAISLLRTATIPKTTSGKIRRFACREGFCNETLTTVDNWTASSFRVK